MKKKNLDGEIDLIQIFLTIWKNKILITLLTIFTIVLGFGLAQLKKPKFVLNFKIEPISSFEQSFYLPYNSYLNNMNLNQMIIYLCQLMEGFHSHQIRICQIVTGTRLDIFA